MNTLQKEVSALLLDDCDSTRVLVNKILPSILKPLRNLEKNAFEDFAESLGIFSYSLKENERVDFLATLHETTEMYIRELKNPNNEFSVNLENLKTENAKYCLNVINQ